MSSLYAEKREMKDSLRKTMQFVWSAPPLLTVFLSPNYFNI